jgi:hypothetical protein
MMWVGARTILLTINKNTSSVRGKKHPRRKKNGPKVISEGAGAGDGWMKMKRKRGRARQ